MENADKRERIILAVHIVCIVLSAALFEALLVIDLQDVRASWREWAYLLTLIGFTVLNAAFLAVDIIFRVKRKELIYKFCITAYILGIFFAAGILLLLRTGFFDIVRDAESLEAYLESAGGWMSALFITLQFLQVVILPIPSTVTVVAGAELFNPFWGSVYSLLGILIGSVVAFLIGRYAGSRVVAWLIGKETLEKWMKKIKGKDKLLLTAMFILPVFPDDVLCFVAGMSTMSFWYFAAVIVISRILAIFGTSYLVALIPFSGWGLVVWGILLVLVVILFVFLYKKSDAILGWFEKKFHRETRVTEEKKPDEFMLEVVDPDGSVVTKGVKKSGEDPPDKTNP